MRTLAFLILAFASLQVRAGAIVDFAANNLATAPLTISQLHLIENALAPTYISAADFLNSTGLQECARWESVNAVQGHFSTAGDLQFLVAFISARCPYSDAGEHGNVALFDQNFNLIMYASDVEASTFNQVLGADANGLSEVIASYTHGSHVVFYQTATTLDFKSGQVQTIDNYIGGMVGYSECGIGIADAQEYTSAFFSEANDTVLQKNYERSCGAHHWTFYSNGALHLPND